MPEQLPGSIPQPVREAVAIMRGSLAARLGIAEIAARVGVPTWRLSRQFKRYLHCAPTTYFMGLRLAKARDMLRNTTLPVGDVGAECGYDNAEAFSRAYRARYGVAPSRDRDLP